MAITIQMLLVNVIIALLTIQSAARPSPPNGVYSKVLDDITVEATFGEPEDTELPLILSCKCGQKDWKYSDDLMVKKTGFDIFNIDGGSLGHYRKFLAVVRSNCPRFQLQEPDLQKFIYFASSHTIQTKVLGKFTTLVKA
ncbi:hypothetical protein Pmar_PMAR002348 [Perkinsus marinus ATCC 50983]|uniref:Uncharacterized protein n=1 Tax=Perkinsus marinus (strain ATCC 50983 / TXsc) TaxID=423536 RepID=C5KV24_PERM5|nr:hypothetical protein Pmar_PMAR002348 [Perkinsus marinus ATCC 50983]EER11739.1 hypothetical protein Pmar_PMAR002348 [Perkinsus marinus ATCC 50983]|eukprot:XP_002779944.1 hypothetical protein Pmar_PMAR002348 [Perkinsus marinus ATCC 50983]